MNEKNEKITPNETNPKIIYSKDKKILKQKPPNDKILYFNIVEEIENKNSKREENSI